MKILELFCGTKSFSNVAKSRGHETFTIDIDNQFNPDACINLLNFDISMLPYEFKKPDIIWASPPCTTFSVASIRHYWINGRPKNKKTWEGISLILKTIQIINDIKPKYWFIENPRGMLRKQDFIKSLHRKTITYCQYGDFRQKPTDIWTNLISWIPKPMCSPGSNCHQSARRGEDRGTQYLHGSKSRAIIPKELCLEIIKCIEGDPLFQIK